jgi:uncharacterized protein YggT (Ycf19 family)
MNESQSLLRRILTVLANVLVVLAIAEAVRLVVLFFGALADSNVGEIIVRVTDPITIGFGIDSITTPYGGVFDVDTALTAVLFLLIEWLATALRPRE